MEHTKYSLLHKIDEVNVNLLRKNGLNFFKNLEASSNKLKHGDCKKVKK